MSGPPFLMSNSIVAGSKTADNSASDIGGTWELDAAISQSLIGFPTIAEGLMHSVNGNIVGAANGTGGRTTLDASTVLNPTLADNGGPTKPHAL